MSAARNHHKDSANLNFKLPPALEKFVEEQMKELSLPSRESYVLQLIKEKMEVLGKGPQNVDEYLATLKHGEFLQEGRKEFFADPKYHEARRKGHR